MISIDLVRIVRLCRTASKTRKLPYGSEEQKWILVRKKGKVSNMKKVRFMEKDKTQDGDNND